MDQHTVAKVDEILNRYAASQKAAADAREAAKLRTIGFRREFLRLQKSVIVPAMTEIGELVRNRGCEFEIETAKEITDLRAEEPRTRLLVVVNRGGGGHYRPSLDAICNTGGGSVGFEIRIPTRGSYVAALADVAAASLDHARVHERAVEFLGRIFDGKPL